MTLEQAVYLLRKEYAHAVQVNDMLPGTIKNPTAWALNRTWYLAVQDDAAVSCGALLATREELLEGWGHGWNEYHYIGDDEDPEQFELSECVWIDGHMVNAEGDYFRLAADGKWYGKQYGFRVWRGDSPPTEEQRKAAGWDAGQG